MTGKISQRSGFHWPIKIMFTAILNIILIIYVVNLYKKNGKKVLPMVIRGIPAPLRPMAWQQISHADTRLHQKYSELLRQESNVEKLIARDVQRTFPEEELFQG